MATTTKGTLKYRKIQRTPQTGENAGKQLWYATAVTDREMSFDEFVAHIASHNSPYSRGVVNGVLMDTLDCLQELILDGKSVRFADLGLFSLGMSSRAETTKKAVSAPSIEDVHLIVRNTRTWSNAELKKKCKLQEYGVYSTDADADDDGGNGGGSTPSDSKGDNPQGGGSSTTGGSGSTTGGNTGGSGSSDGDDDHSSME